MAHYLDDRRPTDSVTENFLRACSKSYDSSEDDTIGTCLSKFKVDINAQVKNHLKYEGYTGLHFAIRYSNLKLVQMLLGHPDIDVNKQTNHGKTPIMIAVMVYDTYSSSPKISFIKELLKRPELDVNINCSDKIWTSLAHLIVINRNALELIEMFDEDSRIDWNMLNLNGDTPIILAMKENKRDVVEALLKIKSVDKSKIPKMLADFIKEVNNNKRKRKEEPECPVCLTDYKKNQKIFHCAKGHFVCGRCEARLDHCPECRGPLLGRAYGFEKFLSTILEEAGEEVQDYKEEEEGDSEYEEDDSDGQNDNDDDSESEDD